MIGKVTMPSGIVMALQESGEYVVTLPEGMPEQYADIVARYAMRYDPSDPRAGDGSWHLNYLADCCGGIVEFGLGFRPRPGQCMFEGYENRFRWPHNESAIVIGRVTTRDGIVIALYSDWWWEVMGPEGVPPDLMELMRRNYRDCYDVKRPQDGGDTWPLYQVAAMEGGTVEIVPGRDYPKDERVY